MADKFEQFKREIRADLQLMWGGQSDGNKRIEQMARSIEQNSARIEEQGQKIAEQGQKIAEQGQEIAKSMRETAKLGREVVALGDQMVGRLKQFDQRFGKFIDAMADEIEDRVPLERFENLEDRVRKLEEREGPAA